MIPRAQAPGRAGSALLVSLALVLTACTGHSGAGADEPSGSTASTSSTAAVEDALGADRTGPVQDVWVHERIRTVAEDGTLVDVTGDLSEQLAAEVDDSTAVELVDGVSFTPLDSLHPRIRASDGGLRNDLDVVAGVLRNGDRHGLQVVATPTGDTSVAADDMLMIDLPLSGLAPGAPLIVDFAFGQGIPDPDDPQVGSDVSGPELLRQRMDDDRFHWYAARDGDAVVPGVQTVVGSVPGQRSDPTADQTAGKPDSADPSVSPALDTLGTRTRFHSIADEDGDGGGGGIPLKAQPTTDPVGDIGDCKSWGLQCLSDYFDNMEKGFKESWDDLMNRNLPPGGGGGRGAAGCSGDCGGAHAEPHFTTFDGLRYDLQGAGEFTLARAEGFRAQARLTPWLDSTKVSIVTAVALEVDGHRLTVRMGREPLIRLDGEPMTRAEAQRGFSVGEADAVLYGVDLTIRTPDDGPAMILPGVTRGATDVLVDPGDNEEWAGLLGDHDGDPENDLRPSSGDPLGPDWTPKDLYETFAHSWRITDADSLFDYEDGESTATFTDRDFPSDYIDLASLSTAERSAAETVCRAAGLLPGQSFDDCVFDYAMTGNIEFVRSAVRFGGLLAGAHDGWSQAIPDAEGPTGPMRWDPVGHVLVPTSTEGGGRLVALDAEDGSPAWQRDSVRSPCVAVTATGRVVVPVPGENDRISLAVLDAADGRQLAAAPTALGDCSSMTVVENVVVVQHGDTVLGIDVAAPEVRFELDMPGLQGRPVVSGDGKVWVLRSLDGQVHAEWIDPQDGRPTRVPVPVPTVFGNVAGTPDGVVVGFRGEHEGTSGLLRLGASGPRWQTAVPFTIDDQEITGEPRGPLSVSGDGVAGHLGGDQIGVFDLSTGDPRQVIDPSSFSNNGDRQLLHDGIVVVGPFGGSHWVEAWDIVSNELAWSADAPAADGLNDVKRIGPSTPAGQVVVAGNSEDGVVVSLVGPAR